MVSKEEGDTERIKLPAIRQIVGKDSRMIDDTCSMMEKEKKKRGARIEGLR